MIYLPDKKSIGMWITRAFASALVLLLVASGAPYASAGVTSKTPTNSGLVGWWTLDGADITDKVYDRSGRGNSGYFYGSATTSAKVAGKVGQAMTFNGTGNFIKIQDSSAFDLLNMTLSAWIKIDGSASGDRRIINQQDANYWLLHIFNNQLTTYLSLDAISGVSKGPALNDDKWHFVAISRDTVNDVVTWWIDGEAVGTQSTASNTAYTISENVYIGSFQGTLQFFPGKIDDVRIYNRALSYAEIQQLYNSQQGTQKINTSQNNSLTRGLTGLWSFDSPDIAGVVAYDRRQGNNGTLVNGSAVIGKIGQALGLNGVNGRVTTAAAISSLISATDGTVSVWLKPQGSSVSQAQVYDLPAVFSDTGGYIGVHRGTISGEDRIWAYNWDANADKVGVSYTVDKWTHITWVHTGGNLLIYKDGVLVSSVASGNTQILTGGFKMGTNYLNAASFNGSIDDVRTYNRALSSAEIKLLYNLGR